MCWRRAAVSAFVSAPVLDLFRMASIAASSACAAAIVFGSIAGFADVPDVPVAPVIALGGLGFVTSLPVGFDVAPVAAVGGIAADELGEGPPAAFSNSLRCMRNSVSFARTAGSSADSGAGVPGIVPAVPAVVGGVAAG